MYVGVTIYSLFFSRYFMHLAPQHKPQEKKMAEETKNPRTVKFCAKYLASYIFAKSPKQVSLPRDTVCRRQLVKISMLFDKLTP
jgi:hypothetical protein